MAKVSELSVKVSIDTKACEPLMVMIEAMVRNRAILPGEVIVALDNFAAHAKGLDSLFVTGASKAE